MANINVITPMFLWFFMNFLIAQHGYNAKTTPPVSNELKIQNGICELVSPIRKSNYVKDCEKLTTIDKIQKIGEDNLQEYFCLGLFDRYQKICHEKTKDKNISLSINQEKFDSAIKEMLEKGKTYVNVTCDHFKNLTSPFNNITKEFVDQLNSKLQNPEVCQRMCIDDIEGSLEPLCLVMQFIDSQLMNEKKVIKDAPKQVVATNATENAAANQTSAKLPPAESGKTLKTDEKPNNNNPAPSDINNPKEAPKNTEEKPQKNSVAAEKKSSSVKGDDKAKPDDKNKEKSTKDLVPDKITDEEKIDDDTKPSTDINDDEGFNDNIEPPDAEDPSLVGAEDNADLPPKGNPQSDEEAVAQAAKTETLTHKPVEKDEEVHFFGFVTIIGLVGITGCLLYHHRQKILAMVLEGRRSRGSRGRRRPSTANYRKLDCNLEEAVTSQCNANVTHVIY